MKKLLTFLLCFVFLFGAFGLVACDDSATVSQSAEQTIGSKMPAAKLSVQGVSAPVFGTTLKRFNAGDEDEGVPRVVKRLSATVEPATALNKQVDYTVSWADGAERSDEDVTEYVSVEQDSDGSADATVSCYKGFGDDTIIITVTTREGGFRAFCEVIFSGLISELAIVPQNGLTLTTTSETVSIGGNFLQGGVDYPVHGQTYYDLGVNRIYDFDVNVNNIFDETTYDLSLDVSVSDTPIYISKTQYPEKNYNGQYQGQDDVRQVSLSDLNLDLFEITLNDTSLRIVVKDKLLSNYTDSVCSIKSGLQSVAYYLPKQEEKTITGNWQTVTTVEPISENNACLSAGYFTVTISDSKSGLSDSFKFWISSTAAGLTLSSYTMEF